MANGNDDSDVDRADLMLPDTQQEPERLSGDFCLEPDPSGPHPRHKNPLVAELSRINRRKEPSVLWCGGFPYFDLEWCGTFSFFHLHRGEKHAEEEATCIPDTPET